MTIGAASVNGLSLAGDPNAGRPTLGGNVPVVMFRALRLVGMMEGLDAAIGDASTLVYSSGIRIGAELGESILEKTERNLNEYVKEVTKTVRDLGVGLLSVTELDLDNSFLSLRVDECITCSGMPNIGKKVCHFESGIISGIMEVFTQRRCIIVESKCNGNGDGTCEFEVHIN